MARNGRKASDDALATVLACGATVESAARTVGISVRTVHRRLASAEFQKRLACIRKDMVDRTTAALTGVGMESVRTLIALQDASMPPAVRLGAARAALDLGVKFRESQELAERIALLEARLESVESPGQGQAGLPRLR
jgi:hypothetical protein